MSLRTGSLADLLACADARMYEEKRTRSDRRGPRPAAPAGCLPPQAAPDAGERTAPAAPGEPAPGRLRIA